MTEETVNTGFSESSQDDTEFNEFFNGVEVVLVGTLLRTLVLEDVGEESRVTDFLQGARRKPLVSIDRVYTTKICVERDDDLFIIH